MGYGKKISGIFSAGPSKKQQLQEQVSALLVANDALEHELENQQELLQDIANAGVAVQDDSEALRGNAITIRKHELEIAKLKCKLEHSKAESRKLKSQLDTTEKQSETIQYEYRLLSEAHRALRQKQSEFESAQAATGFTHSNAVVNGPPTPSTSNLNPWASYLSVPTNTLTPDGPNLLYAPGQIVPLRALDTDNVSFLESELRNLKVEYDQYRQKHESMQHAVWSLEPTQFQTAREILSSRIVSARPSRSHTSTTQINHEYDWSPIGFSASDLDGALGPSQLREIVDKLPRGEDFDGFYSRIAHRACISCRRVKFSFQAQEWEDSLSWLDEYPKKDGRFSCCVEHVCSACAIISLESSIQSDWWYNLDSTSWLRCGSSGCGSELKISSLDDLSGHLKSLGSTDHSHILAKYSKAIELRKALRKLQPVPSAEALLIASSFHDNLARHGRMRNPFDTSHDDDPVIPEQLVLGELQDGLVIPIFRQFFRLHGTTRECIACGTEKTALGPTEEEEWHFACADFQGQWLSKLSDFPTRNMMPGCDHEFTMCTECIARFLKSSLDDGLRDKINCPECRRQLTHEEIKHVATAETFERFEKMLLRKILSTEPDFRWCLREGCSNGQLHDVDDLASALVVCEECGYEMCFTHQIKWHKGLTCAEYDSTKEHGDPQYKQTRRWMDKNTKTCPSCKSNIEKDDGCFHMTCQNCKHEFCWECLADWSNIAQEDGSQLATNHAPGCFFRKGTVRATGVHGNDLEEALRARAANM